jgi:6,7-dimethyl-8-ribityllumazine synthase
MSAKEISGDLIARGMKVCIAISRFNDFLTDQLLSGAVDCLVRHGGNAEDVTIIRVPGANELPPAVKRACLTGEFSAVISLGAVIQGATTHAQHISSQVSRSLGQLALESSCVVINGIVFADNLEQGIERCGTKAGNKGWSAMQAAIEMANLYKELG